MNDRKIIPFTTRSGLQIGSTYIPKPRMEDAFSLERQTARRSPVLRWAMWCGLAFAALMLIAGRA